MSVVESLHEIESNKAIIVKGLSTNITDETLGNFLEVISREELRFLYYHGNVKSVVVAQFTCAITDIDEIQKRATKRPLSGQTTSVHMLGNAEGLLVSQLERNFSDVSKSLKLHFEKEENGGVEGCVTKCEVYSDLCLAVVIITNPSTVVPRILHHRHVLEGKKIVVQSYYPVFHDAVIKEHSGHLEGLSNSDTSEDDGYLKPIDSKKPKWQDKTVATVSTHIYEEIHDNFGTLHKDSSATHPDLQVQDHSQQEPEYDVLYSRIGSVGESVGSPFTVSKSSPELWSSDKNRLNFDQKNLDRHHNNLPEDGQGLYPDLYSMLKISPSNDDINSCQNDRRGKDVWSMPERPIDHDYDSCHKSSNLTEQGHQCTEKMQLAHSTVCLLRVLNFSRQHAECRIILNATANFIQISGSEIKVNQTLEDLWINLDNIKEYNQSLSEGTFELLKEMKKSNPEFMVTVLQASYIKACVFLSENISKPEISAYALSKKEAFRALKEITSLIQEQNISYTEGNSHFVSSEEWQRLSAQLQTQRKIKIKVIDKCKRIVLAGFRDDVEAAYKEIRQALNKSYRNTGKPIKITGGKAKLFKYCLQDEINELQIATQNTGGNLDHKFDLDVYSFVVKGNKDVIKDMERKLQTMIWDSWEGSLDLSRITKLKDKELVILSDLMMSRKGNELIRKFSKKNSCVVVVESGDHLTQTNRPSRDERPVGACGRSKSVPDFSHIKTCTVRVKNTNITVKQGDIIREKASLLVNVMGRSRKEDESLISRNFFKAGGPALQQNFQANNDGTSSVILTPGGGSLHCQSVCHMILHKFDDSSKVKYQTRSAFKEVYRIASLQRATSISFPAVGAGRLLQFPEAYSAECMVSEAVLACHNSNYNFQQITFVIYDVSMMDTFVKRLQKENTADQPYVEDPPVRHRNSSAHVEHRHRPTMDDKQERTSRRISGCLNQNLRNTTHPVAKVTLFATSKDHGEKMRQKLQGKIQMWFCAKERIPEYESDDRIKSMPSEIQKEISQLVQDKPLTVEIRRDKGTISLFGEQETVDEVSKQIYKILFKVKISQQKHKAFKHQRGTFEYWRELSVEPGVPQYWKSLKDKGLLTELRDVFLQAINWKGAKLHKVDNKTFNAVASLVESTFDSLKVGRGKDARGLSHSTIRVTKVKRIENIDLYKSYAHKRLCFFGELAKTSSGPLPLRKIRQAANGGIISARKVDKHLLSDMYHQINEHYFFHGTDKSVVANIADKGLDPRHGSDAGMFGPGIYGAECSTKADQYADSQDNRKTTSRNMLLIRMILGNIYVAKDAKKFKIPPCMNCKEPCCKNSKHRPYDSVVADGNWLFREFIVYAKDQCYPEYVITYDRL